MKFFLFITCVGLCFFSCKKKEKTRVEDRIFPVTTQKAIKKDTPLYLEAIGHVESIEQIEIRSRVEGELTGVYFKEGDFVHKGDLLFTIDPRSFQANVKFAEGSLEENIASLKLAQEKVLRYMSLVQEEYFSEIDYKQLQTNAETSEAMVKKSQAELDDAKINLSYCWIYSPIDGKTGILNIDKGNLIKPNDENQLITINQISPIYVTFSISEKFFPTVQCHLKQKQALKVITTYDDFTKDHFDGKLELIDNQIDPETGMIKLRALFENHEKDLWPGQFVKTRLILQMLQDAILIPAEAVDYTQEGPLVYIVSEDQTIDIRKVKLGQRTDGQIVVLHGVFENEKVVTNGALNLHKGARVKIANESL